MFEIRKETPGDIEAIRYVNEQAFGQTVEPDLIDKLRKRGVLTLSLVAVEGNKIVGHIAFSPVTIESESSSFEAITLAPVAVLPSRQKQGIGGKLIKAGIEECRKLKHEIMIVLGHPEYYPRFGFTQANLKGIGCEYEAPPEAFMLLELKQGALAGRTGIVKFQPEFREAV